MIIIFPPARASGKCRSLSRPGRRLQPESRSGESPLFSLRHRVIPPFVKGVASEYPFEREPAPLYRAILLQGLQGILGAGGDVIAAPGAAGGDIPLVKAHQPDQNPLHGLSPKRSSFRHRRKKVSFSSPQGAVNVRFRATRTMSHPWRRRRLFSR